MKFSLQQIRNLDLLARRRVVKTGITLIIALAICFASSQWSCASDDGDNHLDAGQDIDDGEDDQQDDTLDQERNAQGHGDAA